MHRCVAELVNLISRSGVKQCDKEASERVAGYWYCPGHARLAKERLDGIYNAAQARKRSREQ